MYPPVHENLQLYKRLLRNIPMSSGTDYQTFLDATAATADNDDTDDDKPLNSTQTSRGRGKSFWLRKFSSGARSTYHVNPPAVPPSDTMIMSDLLRRDALADYHQAAASAAASAAAADNDPPTQISADSSELNDIRTC